MSERALDEPAAGKVPMCGGKLNEQGVNRAVGQHQPAFGVAAGQG